MRTSLPPHLSGLQILMIYLHRVVLGYGLTAPRLLQEGNIDVKGLATLFDSKAQKHQACTGNQIMLMNCCLLHMSLGFSECL